MKKLFKIAGLILITAMLAACSNGSSSDSDSENGKSKLHYLVNTKFSQV